MPNNTETLIIDGVEYTLIDSTAVHTVDSALSNSSTNPVQNKVVTNALSGKPTIVKLTSTQTSAFGDYYAFPVTLADITAINGAHDGIAVSFGAGSAFGMGETFVAFGNEETLLNGITYLAYSGTFTSATSIESNTFIILLPKTGDSTGGTGYIRTGVTVDSPWGTTANGGAVYPAAMKDVSTLPVGNIAVLGDGYFASDLAKVASGKTGNVIVWGNVSNAIISAPAGSTSYTINSATYTMPDGSTEELSELYFFIEESVAPQKPISVTFNSDSKPVLTFASSLNPTAESTHIYVGASSERHANLIVGYGATTTKDASVIVGNFLYNGGTNSLIAGQKNINTGAVSTLSGVRLKSTKNGSFLTGSDNYNNSNMYSALIGQGHSNTVGPVGTTAVGKYSTISSDTQFVVGNGTSATDRSNAFEAHTDGRATVGADPMNNMDVTTKQYVDFGDTKIPYGRCDATSTDTLFTATVPGITELKDGVCMLLKNGVATSAANFTININNLGAKPAYTNMAAATRESTVFNINYTMMFVYDETRVTGGCWICYRGYDSNTNTVGYQLRTNSSTMVASAAFVRYRLLFTSADGKKWVPANTSTSTNATATRDVLQTPIDPFGEIVYYGTTTAVSANAAVGATVLWQQYTLSLGYSFNRTGAALTLTTNRPVYIKCAPQADGSAIIDATTPYVQSLPSTADGKIYIYLGRAYSATAIELTMNHPVYYYNGGIRLWTGINIAGAIADALDSAEDYADTKIVDAINALDTVYVKKAGDTMTGNLVVPAERIANTYYGISFGRTTQTPVETILYTGIKWVNGAHMPVIHITGYAYGLQSPVEFKIGFYIYSGKIGWQGAVNMGSWNPSIYLFKYTRDSVEYVAVGLAGSCYFLQLQADVQDEMGKFANIVTDSSAWSWSFLTTAGTIPAVDDGATCASVPYKADILDGKIHNQWYGTCDTAASAAAKVVTCAGFALKTGVRISVRFTNGSTSTGTMTLNVNSTGAKNCGVYLYTGAWQNGANRCEKNEVLEFIYDGTYWVTLTPYALRNYGNFNSRLTTANISWANGGLQYFLATSSMATGKPPIDSHILNMNWDTGTTNGAQLAVTHGTTSVIGGRVFTRGQEGSANWGAWREIPRLSGALTNGQIVVSDESTGNALLKGITYDYKLTLSTTFTDVDTDTISFSLSNDQLTGLNDYMSSAVSGGYTGMVHVSFTAPLPNSDTHEAVYIAHSALLDEYDMKWVFSGTVYDSVDKTTYPFTFSYPIASTGPVTATVKLNRASGGGSLDPVEDTDVFLSRSVNFGENKYKFPSLVGGTVAWNQLVPASYKSQTTTPNGTTTYSHARVDFSAQANHVYAVGCNINYNGTLNPLRLYVQISSVYGSPAIDATSANKRADWLVKPTANGNALFVGVSNIATSTKLTSADAWSYDNLTAIDLTLALGPTIADYIYSLEQATTGAGVAWFKQYFPKSYYPYNAGTLISVKPTGVETVGVNQWDEVWEYGEINSTTGANSGSATTAWRTKNYIPVIPGGTYYVTAPVASKNLKARFYDASKNYIGYTNKAGINCFTTTAFTVPDNASYVRFGPAVSDIAVPNNNICVSISNPLYNGTYYPYTNHTYPISPVELRGVSKLVSNKLAFDGDVRASDGTVTRKYGIVDMGTYTWTRVQDTANNTYYFRTTASAIKPAKNGDTPANMVCAIYTTVASSTVSVNNKTIGRNASTYLYVRDDTYTTAADFQTAMSGVYLVYELATPTTESSAALPVPQVVYDGGTESYVDERDVQMPVGQDATYMDATNAIGKLMDSGLVPSSGGANESEGYFLVTDGVTSSDTWHYYKVGKQVTVSGLYTGTSSTATSLSELPFTPKYSSRFILPVMMISPSMMFYLCQVSISANSKIIGTSGHFSSGGSNLTGSWLNIGQIHSTPITFTYITDD